MCDSTPYDIIFMDMNMPKVNGLVRQHRNPLLPCSRGHIDFVCLRSGTATPGRRSEPVIKFTKLKAGQHLHRHGLVLRRGAVIT